MLAPSLSRFEFRAPAHIRLQPCTHTVTALHTYSYSLATSGCSLDTNGCSPCCTGLQLGVLP